MLRLVNIFPIFSKKENWKKKWCFRGENAEQRCEILQSWCYYLCGVSCKKTIQRFMFRLLRPSDSSPSATAFDSFSYRIRLLQLSHSSPSATAFDSFSHCIRLLHLMHSTHSANSVVSFSHRSRMCQLNEVDELVKWSGWVRIMKFMISAQLPIHANGKAKSGLLLPLWFLYENVLLFSIATSITNTFNSLIISE